MDSKPLYASKINVVQGVMAIIAVLCDPGLQDLNIIPVQYLPKLIWVCNALTFILRTFFSGAKLTWRQENFPQ